MSATTTKKNDKAEKPAKVEKEKVEKLDYLKLCNPDLIDANGKLSGIPVIGAEEGSWTPNVHGMLKKSTFALDADYMDFSANLDELRRDALTERIATKRKRAELNRKFGDPKQRDAANRLIGMMSAMEELKKTLAAQGVNVEDLIGA